MEPFVLSNSKLHDFENMCPIAFKAKYIDLSLPPQKPSLEQELGNYFETLVIGGGINGAFELDKSEYGKQIQYGVYGPRVEAQAQDCKRYLKSLGGKIIKRQEYIKVQISNLDGTQTMWIEGTLDITYRFADGKLAVIDLKFTGDTENDFGKFAWGSPEKMDLSQIVHYDLLLKIKYNEDPDAYYWVFDKGTDTKQKLIKCNISEYATHMHIDRLFSAHNEISISIAMNEWEPKNTWDNCSKCKVQNCRFRRVMPEYYIIDL